MGQLSIIASVLLYVCTFGFSSLLSKTNIQNRVIKLFLVIFPPVVLAMFRYNVGYDYNSYIEAFNNAYDMTFESIIKGYEVGDPIAYYLITKIVTIFNSERVYLMILAILSLIPGISYILQDWENKEAKPMMVFMYLFSPFIFSLSASKQGIALSFLMLSIKYVYDRKIIKFSLCTLVAFLFHSTAIVFFPVYFFINNKREIGTLKKIVIIVASLFVIMNLQWILSGFMGGRYETYALDFVEGRNRTFWLYAFISVVFLFIRKKLIAIDKRNDLLIIMMIIGAICQYLGFYNAFAKRIGEYFLMTQVLLIPQCMYLFTDKSKKIFNFLTALYIILIFLIANPVAESGMGFVPYQFIF